MTGQSSEDTQALHNSADFRVKFHRFLFYICFFPRSNGSNQNTWNSF